MPHAADAQNSAYGYTTFENSGSASAQEAFLKGVLMLHSFEYVDAREAFQEAQREDPSFALAYWGEAMTHNHPIWMRQYQDGAVEALRKLGATPEARYAKAPTERERAYLRAVDVLFGEIGGDATKEERDDAYAEAMRQLAEDHPQDLDAQAFYALALLGTAHEGRDYATYMRAAAVAEEVFAANPQHPGAAHYLIHAYDDPIHAPLGLRPARVYADLAPSASHALHMPSHIFFALGDWDAATASNEDSYRAAADRSAARGEDLSGHGYHALYWLGYSYLQQGRTADALEVMARADSMEAGGSFGAMRVTRTLEAHRVVETEQPLRNGKEPWKPATTFRIETVERYTDAYRAYLQGEADALRKHAQKLDTMSERGSASTRIMSLQARGLHLLLSGETDAAVDLLEEAADLEHAQPILFGPPSPPKPSSELLGDVLLKLWREEEARAAYLRVEERAPNRRLTRERLASIGLEGGAVESGELGER
jgi:tetratricopeptide (TPR) repeat protein